MGRGSSSGSNGSAPRRGDADFDLRWATAALHNPANPPLADHVAQCSWIGYGYAYIPETMRLIGSWTPLEKNGPWPGGADIHLAAGRANGLGEYAGEDVLIAYTVEADEEIDHGYYIEPRGECRTPAEAADLLNDLLRLEQHTGPPVRGSELKQEIGPVAVGAAPRKRAEDPQELTEYLERTAPKPGEFAFLDGLTSGTGFVYDPDSFRTLASTTVPAGEEDHEAELDLYVVAGKASALGDRAGAHAYIGFYMDDGDIGERDLFVTSEGDDYEQVTQFLAETVSQMGRDAPNAGDLISAARSRLHPVRRDLPAGTAAESLLYGGR